MKPRHLTFIAAVAASSCAPGSSLPTESDVLELQMLPADNLCRVRGADVPCSELPAYLRDTTHASPDTPLSIQWEGGVPPSRERLSALAQSLKQVGFKTVGFVAISRYDSASSGRDR